MRNEPIKTLKEEEGRIVISVKDIPLTFIYDGLAIRIADHDPDKAKIPASLLEMACRKAIEHFKGKAQPVTQKQ